MTFIKDESLKIYSKNKFFVIPYKKGITEFFIISFHKREIIINSLLKYPCTLKDINFIPEIYMKVHYMNFL